MRAGDLIAVNGNLYEYEGMEDAYYTKNVKFHKASIVDIDEEGRMTSTGITTYFTDYEISNRGINLTEKQWIGLVKQFIEHEYDLTEEAIEEAVQDIVCRCFATTRIPLVEELPNYIAIYMNR